MLLQGRWDEEPVNGQSEGEGQLLPQVDLAQIEEVFIPHYVHPIPVSYAGHSYP